MGRKIINWSAAAGRIHTFDRKIIHNSKTAVFREREAAVFGPYLNGASLWNRSQNCCCSASKAVHLWRRSVTSFACSGATCCFTVMATFFMLFHFSGSSCKANLSVVRFPRRSCLSHSPELDRAQMLPSVLQDGMMMRWCHLPIPHNLPSTHFLDFLPQLLSTITYCSLNINLLALNLWPSKSSKFVKTWNAKETFRFFLKEDIFTIFGFYCFYCISTETTLTPSLFYILQDCLVIFFYVPHFLLDHLNKFQICFFFLNQNTGSFLRKKIIHLNSPTNLQHCLLPYVLSFQNLLDITNMLHIIVPKQILSQLQALFFICCTPLYPNLKS